MKEVREGVDDWNGGSSGKLFNESVTMRAYDQAVEVTGKDTGGILNAFSPSDLRTGLVDDKRVAT
jgi:hypothetical protein